MRTLVIVRHAKAESPDGVRDIDRHLSARGRRDSRQAGTWLRHSTKRPDLVLSSPSRRTIETADEIVSGYDAPAPTVRSEQRLYEASLSDVLEVLRALPKKAGTVVLIGHNPSVSALATELAGQPVDLRTCGVAVVSVPRAWAEIAGGGGLLETVQTPRGVKPHDSGAS